MAYFVGQPIVKGAITDVHDSELNKLGTEAKDNLGNTYIYLKGVASVIAGSWVVYDEAFLTTGLDTDVAATLTPNMVAVAMAAIVANKYGWFLIDGSGSAGAGTVADNARVFPTATVFICDDTGTAGQQIVPAVWRSADSSSLATVEIHRPSIGINVA
jgi:hypothetical protein